MPRDLATETRRAAGPDLSHRVGVVASGPGGTWLVKVGGVALTGVGWAGSYSPSAGDQVYVVRRGTGWFVVDSIVFRG